MSGNAIAPRQNTDTPAPPGRTWDITTDSGFTATGYLPAWAETDPSKTGVPLDRLRAELSDLCHEAPFGGQFMRVSPAGVDPGTDAVVLGGSINCSPYDQDPMSRVPVANIQVFDDLWIMNLDPPGVVAIAAQFQAFADLLIRKVAPDLAAARDDWATNKMT